MSEIIFYIFLIICIFLGLPIAVMYLANAGINEFSRNKSKMRPANGDRVYSLDVGLKILFIIGLVAFTVDFDFGQGSGLHGPIQSGFTFIIIWVVFLFGVHKIILNSNNIIITHRLFLRKNIEVDDIKTIIQALGYYKVIHSKGTFRFTDLLTGSTGLVNSLVHLNPNIEYKKFDVKDMYKNPLSIGFVFGFVETGVVLCLIIGMVLWFYIKN